MGRDQTQVTARRAVEVMMQSLLRRPRSFTAMGTGLSDVIRLAHDAGIPNRTVSVVGGQLMEEMGDGRVRPGATRRAMRGLNRIRASSSVDQVVFDAAVTRIRIGLRTFLLDHAGAVETLRRQLQANPEMTDDEIDLVVDALLVGSRVVQL